MNILVYPAKFKIRSKADANKFLNCHDLKEFGFAEADIHWDDGSFDYWLDPITKQVSMKLISQRSNPFFPLVQSARPIDMIFETRRFINKQVFG